MTQVKIDTEITEGIQIIILDAFGGKSPLVSKMNATDEGIIRFAVSKNFQTEIDDPNHNVNKAQMNLDLATLEQDGKGNTPEANTLRDAIRAAERSVPKVPNPADAARFAIERIKGDIQDGLFDKTQTKQAKDEAAALAEASDRAAQAAELATKVQFEDPVPATIVPAE